jgi:ribosomal protein S12 methylthiotransferase
VPGLTLRTTAIVGFPGETDEEFEELLGLLKEVRFDHVGAFAYSEEEDTPAATMPDPVPMPVRRERLEQLLDLQRTLTQEKNDARVGTLQTVLVDEVEEGLAVARGAWQAPEVDGVVEIEEGGGLSCGTFVDVEITGVVDLDLTARVAP